MLKYCGYSVTFQEVPNEVALTISISGCTKRCEGCHSSWLQSDIGDELDIPDVRHLINEYRDGITCVCFMGEGNDPKKLAELIIAAKEMGEKVCVYSGENNVWDVHCLNQLSPGEYPDYLKIGAYNWKLGALDSPTTNQKMLRWNPNESRYEDITSAFWKEKI